eukprot:snap_masked-scaffold_40-processed-gene-2.27-mRNA-1 protein AED:0.94 eAED:1.00 QI:0/-1/0/1/-1/1/1/0/294
MSKRLKLCEVREKYRTGNNKENYLAQFGKNLGFSPLTLVLEDENVKLVDLKDQIAKYVVTDIQIIACHLHEDLIRFERFETSIKGWNTTCETVFNQVFNWNNLDVEDLKLSLKPVIFLIDTNLHRKDEIYGIPRRMSRFLAPRQRDDLLSLEVDHNLHSSMIKLVDLRKKLERTFTIGPLKGFCSMDNLKLDFFDNNLSFEDTSSLTRAGRGIRRFFRTIIYGKKPIPGIALTSDTTDEESIYSYDSTLADFEFGECGEYGQYMLQEEYNPASKDNISSILSFLLKATYYEIFG